MKPQVGGDYVKLGYCKLCSSALLGSIGSSQLDCWHQPSLLTCFRRPQDVFHLHVCHRRLDSSGLRARLLCLGGPDQPREVKTLQPRRSQYYAHIRHYPHAAVLEIGKLLGRAAQVQNAGGAISKRRWTTENLRCRHVAELR